MYPSIYNYSYRNATDGGKRYNKMFKFGNTLQKTAKVLAHSKYFSSYFTLKVNCGENRRFMSQQTINLLIFTEIPANLNVSKKENVTTERQKSKMCRCLFNL